MRDRLWAPWRGVVGICAAVFVVAQVAVRGWIIFHGYYTQDDYTMLVLGAEGSLGFGYLFQEYSGHVWPGGFLITWVTAHLHPESWALTAGFLLALQTFGAVMMWLVLCRILPASRLRLALLAVFLFSPLTLWSLQWWAQAIGYLPVTACLLVAVWALLVRLQEGVRWASPLVVAMFILGVSFQERAFLFPLVLGGVAACACTETSVWQGCRRALVRLRGLWATTAACAIGMLALHLSISGGGGEGGSRVPVGQFAEVARDLVLKTLLPGLWGGPWVGEVPNDGALSPHVAAVVAGAVLSTVLLGFVLWFGGPRVRAAGLLLFLYVIGDLALLYGGRIQSGLSLGLLPRYAADVVPVAVVCGAWALLDVRERRPRLAAGVGWRRGGVVLLVAYLVGCGITTAFLAPHQLHRDDRTYVANLTEDLRENPSATVFDTRTPEGVMVFWFGDDQRVSTLAPVVPVTMPIDVPGPDLRVVTRKGRLVEPEFTLVEAFELPDRACPVPVSETRVRVDRAAPIDVDNQVLRLEYFSAHDAFLTLVVDGTEQTTVLEKGAGRIDFIIDHARTDHVSLELDRDATACVTSLMTGFPRAPGED